MSEKVMEVRVKDNYPDEQIIEIETERLRDFKNHPFRIIADEQMEALINSIARYGILNPLIVRPMPEGVYEIVSGHRRKYAARQLGYRKVPVVIRVMTDEEAVISMVDSNLQRKEICHSEKAYAIKMKYEAMKYVPGKKDSGQDGHRIKGLRTVQILGREFGSSPKQIQRYLKVADLIPELMEKLDEGEISLNPAYELSFLEVEDQKMVLDAMNLLQAFPSISQAQRIKKLGQEGKLTQEKARQVLLEVKKGELNRVVFKNEQMYRYFPRSYTPERMRDEILKILEQWKNRKRVNGDKEDERNV